MYLYDDALLRNKTVQTQLSIKQTERESELNLIKYFLSFQEDHVYTEVKYNCEKSASVISALLSADLCLISVLNCVIKHDLHGGDEVV